MPSVHSQHKGGGLRPPPPFVVSFVLAVNTGRILVLRRKTCALLRAKTSALLRRKTCAVLRAGKCALFRANTKDLHRLPGPPQLSLDVLFDFFKDISQLKHLVLTPLHPRAAGAIARCFSDFFTDLSANTSSFESISGRRSSQKVLKSMCLIGGVHEQVKKHCARVRPEQLLW